MSSVTFSVGIGGDGSTVTDDSNASTGLANGGHRTRFVPALTQFVNIANTFVANASIAAAISGSAFRNKLTNGDFQVWQRGTTFTNPDNVNLYTADRWAVFRNSYAAGLTVTQQSVQTNSKSIRVQRTAGNSLLNYISLAQSLETIEVKKLAGKTVTLQFKALKGANFSESTNTLTAQIIYGTGTDGNTASGFATQTAIGTLAATLTTTNALFSLTTALPSNATQLAVQFSYTPVSTAGTNDYFEITDAQLEEGSNATAFERRPYSVELGICKRYFNRLVDKTSNHSIGNGVAISTTAMQLQRFLEVEMRTTPAVKHSGAANFICINGSGGSAGTATAITLGITKTNFVRFDVTVASGLTIGQAASCQSQNTSATLDLDAEL